MTVVDRACMKRPAGLAAVDDGARAAVGAMCGGVVAVFLALVKVLAHRFACILVERAIRPGTNV